MIVCPKCNYERRPTDTAPESECPRCGVIYSKAISRASSTSLPSPVPNSPRSTSKATRPGEDLDDVGQISFARAFAHRHKVLIGAIVTSLVVGYFVGREHLKYEIRSALGDATEGFRRALTGAAPQPAKPKVIAAKNQPITQKLTRKGYEKGEYGRDEITFAMDFTNQTGKPIRAFDGVLTFTDLLGNEIYGAKLAINEPIATGGTYSWSGKLDYNQFIAAHEQLRTAQTANVKTSLSVNKVLFDDGQVKEYGQ